MDADRRRAPRYPMKKDVFDVLVHDFALRGTVTDMGTGGLAFEYIPAARKGVESNMIDMICSLNPQYCFHGIPCRTVYDIPVLSENRGFRGGEFRRRGLEFRNLAEDQILKLRSAIECGTEHFV